jgi:hypothetical protein
MTPIRLQGTLHNLLSPCIPIFYFLNCLWRTYEQVTESSQSATSRVFAELFSLHVKILNALQETENSKRFLRYLFIKGLTIDRRYIVCWAIYNWYVCNVDTRHSYLPRSMLDAQLFLQPEFVPHREHCLNYDDQIDWRPIRPKARYP